MLNRIFAAAVMASALMLPAMAAAPTSDIVVTAQKGRVDTAVFGKRPFMRSPRLSPDGKKIAVMMSRNGVDNLGYIDLAAKGTPTKFFARAEEFREAGDRTIGEWFWVGNRTILFTLLSREIIQGQRGDLRRLVAYDIESGKLTPLAWDDTSGDGGDVLHIDDEKEHVMIQRGSFRNEQRAFQPEVIDIDVRTGKFSTVMRPNIVASNWIVDGDGVVRASTDSDEDGNLRVMYRSDADGTMSTVSNARDKTFTNSQLIPQVFLKGDMAYATSNKDNYRRLYKINMKTMTIVGDPVFEVPGYDVEGVIPNEAGDDIIGVRYVDTRDRIKWLEPRHVAIQKFFDEEFGAGNAQIVSSNDGDTKLVMFIGKPDAPGGYYIYETETGKLQLLGWFHPILKGAELNPTETIRYKASDGMEIAAVITYPRHRKSRKNLPVVVMPHGGPFGIRDKEEFGFFPWHQAIAELGYVVIQPNYRGSGGYGKEFVKEGRKPNGYGNRMQDDLNDAVTWFAAQGLVDKGRACIMGWSYGGYATARGAQRDGDFWKCAIAGAGVYDFPMMKAYDTDTFGSFGASYQATADDLVAISSARHPEGKWAPILIVAGLRDARIPIEQARTLVSRLKGAGKKEGVDFRYVEQPMGTHNLPYEDVHIQWLVEAEKWLARFNPAYIATDSDKPVPVVVTVDTK